MNSFSPKLWRLRKEREIGTTKAITAAFRSTMRAKGKTTGTDASNNGKLLEKMINIGCVGKSTEIHMRAFASAAPKSPNLKKAKDTAPVKTAEKTSGMRKDMPCITAQYAAKAIPTTAMTSHAIFETLLLLISE